MANGLLTVKTEKNIQKILKQSEIKMINDLNLSYRPSDLKPETYYKITELFEKK